MKKILLCMLLAGCAIRLPEAGPISEEGPTARQEMLSDCNAMINRITNGQEPIKVEKFSGIVVFTFVGIGKIFLADARLWSARPGITIKNCQINGIKIMVYLVPKKI